MYCTSVKTRARDVAGSYDATARVLTLVQYTRPADAIRYVNSMWEIQREPYKGDVINSYNDGPPAPGQPPLGPFYELETSSPASTAPHQRYTHVHRTFHFTGPEADDVEEWGARVRSALFVARGTLETERERIVVEANALGTAVLGETLGGSSVAVIRRRLEESLG